MTVYENQEQAEEAIQVLLAVIPELIVESAEDMHQAWLDGREPDVSEDTVRARMERIVSEKFA